MPRGVPFNNTLDLASSRTYQFEMNESYVAWPLLAAFFLASFVLAATPGPGVMYIVTRTIAQGRRAGIASVMGVALGNLVNAVGASVGLAALFALSSAAFTVSKFAGAAYLVYLGVKVLRPTHESVELAQFQEPELSRIFRRGFLVALLNPKTALFFAAFLPQFTSPAGSAIVQNVLFGTVFVLIAACTDTAYVLAAGVAAAAAAAAAAMGNVRMFRAFGRYATAAVFIGLGIFAAASGTPRPK